jgi:hypothetical protein
VDFTIQTTLLWTTLTPDRSRINPIARPAVSSPSRPASSYRRLLLHSLWQVCFSSAPNVFHISFFFISSSPPLRHCPAPVPPPLPKLLSADAAAPDNPKTLTQRRLPPPAEPLASDAAAPSLPHRTARSAVTLRHRVAPRRRRHPQLQSEILTGPSSTHLDSGRSCSSSSARPVAL